MERKDSSAVIKYKIPFSKGKRLIVLEFSAVIILNETFQSFLITVSLQLPSSEFSLIGCKLYVTT